MLSEPRVRRSCRWAVAALIPAACLLMPGCASQSWISSLPIPGLYNSPKAEEVAPADAWRLAESFAASRPGCEPLVGRGDSMLPLYRDRTVLVVEAMKMWQLRGGMTVVYIGDKGRPVAHILIRRTPRGWIAMGAGNRRPDETWVTSGNYLGTVVKAYVPVAQDTRIAATPSAAGRLVALMAGDVSGADRSRPLE